jgi:apolipoprotein N-acyltransferase
VGRAISGERVLVCVPTYNERENLPDITARLRAAVPDADILVIDDGSPDGTGDLADELAAADATVHTLHRTVKAGLGAAYVAGFGWALERGYDVVVEIDADGSHQPEQLPHLLEALAGADLVIGSRWVAGGEVHNWPVGRRVLSRGANAYTRLALGLPVKDATAGFRAYRAAVLRARDLQEVASRGYCFQVDLAWQAWLSGFRVLEVPITFVERERGQSKMSRAIVLEALWRVTWWAVRSHRRRPKRVATPGTDGATTGASDGGLPPLPPSPAPPGDELVGDELVGSAASASNGSGPAHGSGGQIQRRFGRRARAKVQAVPEVPGQVAGNGNGSAGERNEATPDVPVDPTPEAAEA